MYKEKATTEEWYDEQIVCEMHFFNIFSRIYHSDISPVAIRGTYLIMKKGIFNHCQTDIIMVG